VKTGANTEREEPLTGVILVGESKTGEGECVAGESSHRGGGVPRVEGGGGAKRGSIKERGEFSVARGGKKFPCRHRVLFRLQEGDGSDVGGKGEVFDRGVIRENKQQRRMMKKEREEKVKWKKNHLLSKKGSPSTIKNPGRGGEDYPRRHRGTRIIDQVDRIPRLFSRPERHFQRKNTVKEQSSP